jgi:hypothetical protein
MPVPTILVKTEVQVKHSRDVTRVRRMSTALNEQYKQRGRHCKGCCLAFCLLVGVGTVILVLSGQVGASADFAMSHNSTVSDII